MLLTARNLGKHYGPRLLFSGITLGLDEGERVGLIGANGSGKSTLLRIFAGIETPDDGELIAKRGLRVGYVPQEDSFDPEKSCLDTVADAADSHLDEHERHVRAYQLLDRAQFPDPSALTKTLSGGWRKRLAVVRQLAREPDLMLMDEPTNHLDLEGIEWLEDLIDQARFATLIVSHDRRFLEESAKRIIDLSRSYPDGFLSHVGTYSEFVEKREEFMVAQQGRQQAVASGVKREIEWLRRGAKARTTKAKGRIERAHDMMRELADLKTRNAEQKSAAIDFASSGRQTRKLIEFKGVTKSMGGKLLFKEVDFVLSPGQKLGLLGPNGSGKSTMIKLVRDVLQPDAGQIIRADFLKIVVFDQHREQLDQNQTLRKALSPGGDSLIVRGVPMHITGWARQFLFRTEQLDMPVYELSGGEQARVLIARLMLLEADVLILDEPTNDLDIPTLDVLESSLELFPGAIILVTHDRYLLDRLASQILALDGKGSAKMWADLSQWERARMLEEAIEAETKRERSTAEAQSGKREKKGSVPLKVDAFKVGVADAVGGEEKRNDPFIVPLPKKKLSWKEQRELEAMEDTILEAETRVGQLQAMADDPANLTDHVKARELYESLGEAQRRVEQLYERWTELSGRA